MEGLVYLPNGKMYGVSEETAGDYLDIYEIDVVNGEMTKIKIFATTPGEVADGLIVGGASRIPYSVSSSAFYIGVVRRHIHANIYVHQLWKIDLDRLSMKLARNIFITTTSPYPIGDMTVTTNGELMIVFDEDPTNQFTLAENIYVCNRGG